MIKNVVLFLLPQHAVLFVALALVFHQDQKVPPVAL